MKKLITLLLCLVIAIGTPCMFGCGDATFNGNYKEVSADSTEVQQFSEATAKSEMVDVTKGVEVEFKIKGNAGGSDMDISANVKVAAEGEGNDVKLQAAGSLKGKVKSSDANADMNFNIYYTNGYGYIGGKMKATASGTSAEEELKFKMRWDIENSLNEIMGIASDEIDLPAGEMEGLTQGNVFANLIAEFEGQEGVKIYIDADGRKARIEVSEFDVEGTKLSGAIFFVYDENYNMTAFKLDFKAKTAENEEVSAYLVIKGFNGTVTLPSETELKTYLDFSLTAGAMLGF